VLKENEGRLPSFFFNGYKTVILFCMKTAISIPEPTFRAAERFANQHKLSRSELYSQAIKEYLERHEPTSITERINALCQDVDTSPDEFLANLSARVISQNSSEAHSRATPMLLRPDYLENAAAKTVNLESRTSA
jgi:hypothetical protein